MGVLRIGNVTFNIGRSPLRNVDTAVIEVSDSDHMVIAFLNSKTGEVVARIRVALLDIRTVAETVVAGAKSKGIAIAGVQIADQDEPPVH